MMSMRKDYEERDDEWRHIEGALMFFHFYSSSSSIYSIQHVSLMCIALYPHRMSESIKKEEGCNKVYNYISFIYMPRPKQSTKIEFDTWSTRWNLKSWRAPAAVAHMAHTRLLRDGSPRVWLDRLLDMFQDDNYYMQRRWWPVDALLLPVQLSIWFFLFIYLKKSFSFNNVDPIIPL